MIPVHVGEKPQIKRRQLFDFDRGVGQALGGQPVAQVGLNAYFPNE
jgi:hypothetical protein